MQQDGRQTVRTVSATHPYMLKHAAGFEPANIPKDIIDVVYQAFASRKLVAATRQGEERGPPCGGTLAGHSLYRLSYTPFPAHWDSNLGHNVLFPSILVADTSLLEKAWVLLLDKEAADVFAPFWS